MIFIENEGIELKEIVTDDIKKEIIAFANTHGGKLYVGVRDDGSVVGVDDPNSVCLQISNMVRDSIRPDITMFVHYRTIIEEGKNIILVEIQCGTNRPYYLAKKGMRPEGVYVRQGYSSVPATETAIRRLITESDGKPFEAMRSFNQDLTFVEAQKEFALRNLELGPSQMRTLQLIDIDNLFTNLGYLLSDQCSQSIKVAVFQGEDQTVFKDRREFTGSLFKQMNEVYDFIDFHNRTFAKIEKLLRIDTRDYPEVAIREALLNILVHRDYSFSASSFINIYSDRMEFVSAGGLVEGMELSDIQVGISICRNNDLSIIFYRLHLIEAFGTGLKKIMKAYEKAQEKPHIEVTNNAFKITLPNMNYKREKVHNQVAQEGKPQEGLSLQEEEVLDFAAARGYITKKDISNLLKVSPSTSLRILNNLLSRHLLKAQGRARSTSYSLALKEE